MDLEQLLSKGSDEVVPAGSDAGKANRSVWHRVMVVLLVLWVTFGAIYLRFRLVLTAIQAEMRQRLFRRGATKLATAELPLETCDGGRNESCGEEEGSNSEEEQPWSSSRAVRTRCDVEDIMDGTTPTQRALHPMDD